VLLNEPDQQTAEETERRDIESTPKLDDTNNDDSARHSRNSPHSQASDTNLLTHERFQSPVASFSSIDGVENAVESHNSHSNGQLYHPVDNLPAAEAMVPTQSLNISLSSVPYGDDNIYIGDLVWIPLPVGKETPAKICYIRDLDGEIQFVYVFWVCSKRQARVLNQGGNGNTYVGSTLHEIGRVNGKLTSEERRMLANGTVLSGERTGIREIGCEEAWVRAKKSATIRSSEDVSAPVPPAPSHHTSTDILSFGNDTGGHEETPEPKDSNGKSSVLRDTHSVIVLANRQLDADASSPERDPTPQEILNHDTTTQGETPTVHPNTSGAVLPDDSVEATSSEEQPPRRQEVWYKIAINYRQVYTVDLIAPETFPWEDLKSLSFAYHADEKYSIGGVVWVRRDDERLDTTPVKIHEIRENNEEKLLCVLWFLSHERALEVGCRNGKSEWPESTGSGYVASNNWCVIALDTILQRLSSEQEALILKGRIFDLKKRLLLSEDRGCVLGEEGTGVMWVLDL
jgi:hypothetical protein